MIPKNHAHDFCIICECISPPRHGKIKNEMLWGNDEIILDTIEIFSNILLMML